MSYITDFENLGFGLFVHFGLYSLYGKGEWANINCHLGDKYDNLTRKFKVNKNWARDIVKTAKIAGCKYITLTTRHHDGFSLYDTCGLNDFDAPHSAAKRDLVKEFVDECNKYEIMPVLYHTLLDWRQPDYKNNFPAYLEYLYKSVEILCSNYGKIGGFWFDGWWDKKDADWQEDRLYGMIKKYQPEAMIINNSGLSLLGKVLHPMIDGVTFERNRPNYDENRDSKHIAGEMCQVFNDHWGYAKNDINYKPIKQILEDLVNCRFCNCNYLLNIGPLGNGKIQDIDKAYLRKIGQWIRLNKNFIYNVKGSGIKCKNAKLFNGEDCYYAVVSDVPMSANSNVALKAENFEVYIDKPIKKAVWLDDNSPVVLKDENSFNTKAFNYGTSLSLRVAKIYLK